MGQDLDSDMLSTITTSARRASSKNKYDDQTSKDARVPPVQIGQKDQLGNRALRPARERLHYSQQWLSMVLALLVPLCCRPSEEALLAQPLAEMFQKAQHPKRDLELDLCVVSTRKSRQSSS